MPTVLRPRPVHEMRGHERLHAPTRSAVPVPGRSSHVPEPRERRDRMGVAGCLTIFIVIGTGIFLFGLAGTAGPYRDALRRTGDPRTFFGAMALGAVFVLVALRMLQIALTGAEHARRRRGVQGREPWLSDYPWRPEGMEPDYTDPSGSVLGRIGLLALIALFNLALGAGLLFLVVIVVLDLFALLILVDGLLKLWQAARYRRPRVRWLTFPAFLGGRLEGVVELARPIAANGPARATLRCVREEELVHEGVDGETTEEVPFVLYSQTREIPTGEEPLRELPLGFEVPNDLPGTDLGRVLPTYWQVAVQVPVTGPDFDSVFLAPVYARRGGASPRRHP